ncbi:MAG: hypothetical protein Q4G51_13720 [Dermatophilus congolensis]|nr:hypothetical protein [Dermatophilus congolensis]
MSWSRREVLRGLAAASGGIGLAAAAGCTNETPQPTGTGTATTPLSAPTTVSTSPGFGPAPRVVDGLSTVATVEGDQLRLHTEAGDLRFWAGVRLTGVLPGSSPDASGAAGATAAHYRRWIAAIGAFGARFLHLDRLHPQACYVELARYNAEHPQAPLYLVQGVTLPAGRATDPDLYRNGETERMRDAVTRTAAMVLGEDDQNTDVSAWLAACVIDLAWGPERIAASDAANSRRTAEAGTYVTPAKGATPTEIWLAARLDELAQMLAAKSITVPLAFVGRPESDPLDHPAPKSPPQDVVELDARRVTATPAWPAGVFAYYSAQPYRPGFVSVDPAYSDTADPYLAYLAALRSTLAMPLMIGAFGVSSSLGSGFDGPAERSQGDHDEAEKFEIEAQLLRAFESNGLAGGLLAHWHDDWSGRTWNTMARTALVPESRRMIVHDPLTADQWGGVVAFEPRRQGEKVVHSAPEDGLQRVLVDFDAAWFYLTLEFSGRVTSPVELGFDLLGNGGIRLPGGSGKPIHDIALRTVPTMSTTYLFSRAAIDPLLVDGVPLVAIPSDRSRGWHLQRLMLSPPAANDSTPGLSRLDYLDVGNLKLGAWEPAAADFDARATWHLSRESSSAPAKLRYRLPWGLIGLLDPAARGALSFAGNEPEIVTARAMTVTIESSTPGSPVDFPVSLPTWSSVRYTERVKQGAATLSDAFAATSRVAR